GRSRCTSRRAFHRALSSPLSPSSPVPPPPASPFSFTAPSTTEIYTLSLHDALPILQKKGRVDEHGDRRGAGRYPGRFRTPSGRRDRKSTRLNSSHVSISYAVFCLKKKKSRAQRPARWRGGRQRGSYAMRRTLPGGAA